MIRQILSLLPGGYQLLVRTRSWRDLPGHLAHFHGVYISFYCYLQSRSGAEIQLTGILKLLAYWLAFTSIYELGYLWNDLEAIKYEPGPPNRIVPKIILEHIGVFVVIRIALFAAVLATVAQPNRGMFAALCVLTLTVYGLHNSRPKTGRLTTFAALRFLRLAWPAFLLSYNPAVDAQLAVFALTAALIESLHYLGVDARQRHSLFLVGCALGFGFFAVTENAFNWSAYPLAVAAAASLRDFAKLKLKRPAAPVVAPQFNRFSAGERKQ